MSDSASRKTEAQLSKTVQSQVASSAEQPSIGDLSAIQSEIENPASNPHSIGDMNNVDAATNSDVLGDITLLEEAFAEMEDSAEGQDDDIPMLHSTIEEPSVNVLAEAQNQSHSIPVLDQQPTEFVSQSMPAANSEPVSMSADALETPDIPTLDTNSSVDSKPLSDPSVSNLLTEESKLETPAAQSSHSAFNLSDIEEIPTETVGNSAIETPVHLETADIPTLASNSSVDSQATSEPVLSNIDNLPKNESKLEIPTTQSSHSNFSLSDIDNPATTPENIDLPDTPTTPTIATNSSVGSQSTSEPVLSNMVNLPQNESKLESPTAQSSHSNFSLSDIDNPAESESLANMEPVVTTFDAVDDEHLETLATTPTPEGSAPVDSIWADDDASVEPPAFSSSEPQPNATKNASLPSEASINNQTAESSKITLSSIAANFDGTSVTTSMHEELTDSKISDEVFTNDSMHSTIEEKIAKATGDTTSSGFHDIPMANEHVSDLPETELAPGFVEDIAQSHFSTPVGELIPQEEPTQAYQSPPPSAETPMNMSIPYELHSQLSKKIDELVLDATMSLTNELEQQLSLKLESLLGSAVESVLPRLVDQMANELRSEVKGRVRQQLPIIVNDVLSKTRLS